MNKRNKNKTQLIIILVTVLFMATAYRFDGEGGYVSAKSNSLSAPDDVVVIQSGKRALKLKWKKVKGAKGYEIRKAKGNLGGYRKLKTLKKNSYRDKNVRGGGSGTYKVRAYTFQGGKKVYSPYSYTVSAKVCKKKDKRKNAVKPELALSAEQIKGTTGYLLLNVGESINKYYEEFFVTVNGPKKKGKKGRYKPLHEKVRWFSTDSSIVKVKSKWDIKAGNKPGKAYIYVRTHNGKRSNKIQVVVKDYAHQPVEIKYAPGSLQVIFNMCEKEIRDICSYYAVHNNMKFGEIYEINYDGEKYTTRGTLKDTLLLPKIKSVLEKSPYPGTWISITSGRVEIKIYNHPVAEETLTYFFKRAPVAEKHHEEISPYWYYQKVWYV